MTIFYKDLTERTHMLGDLMLTASQLGLFTTVGVYPRYSNKALSVSKGWTGIEKPESRAPMIARIKVLQLLSLPPRVKFALSPREELQLGPDFDYPGGVMKVVDNRRYVVAGSAQSGTTDLMLASILLYAMQYECRFHHFGVRHVTVEDALSAVRLDEKYFGSEAIYLPTGHGTEMEHERWYIPWETDLSPNGTVWLEHQYFNCQVTTQKKFHWDVATMAPLNLLQFVGTCLNSEPTIWEAGLNDPCGMITTMNGDVQVAMMARDRWWEVPQE